MTDNTKQNGWRFLVTIVADESMANIVERHLEKDFIEGAGLFANITDIPKEDITEDDFAMIEVYDCNASFISFIDGLKRNSIIGEDAFLDMEQKAVLFNFLHYLATYIKKHTDRPAETKNMIVAEMEKLDIIPGWGLIFQILILQGLWEWLSCVNIQKGGNGFYELQSFMKWLKENLQNKVAQFALMPYSNGDVKLKSFGNFLYDTQIGREVHDELWEELQHEKSNDNVNRKQTTQQNDDTKERDPKILQILKYSEDNYDYFLTEIKGKNLKECADVFKKYIKTNKAIKPSNLRGSLKWMQEFLQEITGETKTKQTFCRWIQ